VATLAVVLALPAATAALARPGSMPAVHPIESWLILAIVIVGWLNFIGTRRGIAATLVTGGLLLAIRPFLPLVDPEQLVRGMLAAPAIDALAAVVAADVSRFTTSMSPLFGSAQLVRWSFIKPSRMLPRKVRNC